MIIVYPLITSKRVAPNVLPGICKALEKYVLVYEQDKIFKIINDKVRKGGGVPGGPRNMRARMKNKRITLEYCDYLNEDEETSGGTTAGPADPNIVRVPTREPVGDTGERDFPDRAGAHETVRVNVPRADTLTVEPTWVHMSTPGGTQILGIKVVPFVIDSDASLLKLMQNDRYRAKMSRVIQIHVRKTLRVMYRIADFAWKKTIGLFAFTGLVGDKITGGTISGDWKKDIVLGLTTFKTNMFVLMNKIDLKQADFTRDAKGVNNLFKLGWKSFVIADDVNKSAAFCMQEFKGMCSIVNYNFLYASVDRTVNQAYETIEDVKRSSGPLFRRTGRFDKMLKDDLANEKLFDYSSTSLMLESLGDKIPSKLKASVKDLTNNPKKLESFQKQATAAIKSKNLKKIEAIAKKANKVSMSFDEIKNILSKIDKNFNKNYDMAKKVLTNSLPGIPQKLMEPSAALIVAASISSRNPDKALRDSLRKVVTDTRKAAKDADEWDKEILYAFIFAVFTVAIAAGTGLGIAYWIAAPILTALGSVMSTIMVALTVIICVIGATMVIAAAFAA